MCIFVPYRAQTRIDQTRTTSRLGYLSATAALERWSRTRCPWRGSHWLCGELIDCPPPWIRFITCRWSRLGLESTLQSTDEDKLKVPGNAIQVIVYNLKVFLALPAFSAIIEEPISHYIGHLINPQTKVNTDCHFIILYTGEIMVLDKCCSGTSSLVLLRWQSYRSQRAFLPARILKSFSTETSLLYLLPKCRIQLVR